MRQLVPSSYRRSRFVSTSCLLALVFCGLPSTALAQGDDDKHWGARISFTPAWTAYETFKKTFFIDAPGSLEGSEFEVGVVRGRTRGGDWGVSYVRKPIKDSTFTETESSCSGTPVSCFSSTTKSELQGTYLDGVEVNFSIPFVTIKNRVQIGINAGVGVGFSKGTVVTTMSSEFSTTLPNGQVIVNRDSSTFTDPAKDVFLPIMPIGKAEAEVGVILAPGFKVKVAAGLNAPSAMAFRLGVVYLIGAN